MADLSEQTANSSRSNDLLPDNKNDAGRIDDSAATETTTKGSQRWIYQTCIVSTTCTIYVSLAQSYGMSGYVLPQIQLPDATDPTIKVSQELGSWFGTIDKSVQ